MTTTDKIIKVFTEAVNSNATKGKVDVKELLAAFKDKGFKDSLKEAAKAKSQPRKKKDPNAPMQRPTRYLMFSREIRPVVKDEMPDLKPNEMITEIAKRWNEKSVDEQAKYQSQVEDELARYEEWLEEHPEDAPDTPRKVERKQSDPYAPKKPKTALQLFKKDMREQVKADTEYKGKELDKELSRMWKEDYADPDSRREWTDEAAKFKSDYDKAKKVYEKKEEGGESKPKRVKSPVKDKLEAKEASKSDRQKSPARSLIKPKRNKKELEDDDESANADV